MGKTFDRFKEKQAENERDVRHIVKSLKDDNYDQERLNRLLSKANEYETKHGGSRANRNVIAAASELLKNNEV